MASEPGRDTSLTQSAGLLLHLIGYGSLKGSNSKPPAAVRWRHCVPGCIYVANTRA